VQMPYATIEANILRVEFSSADFSVASVLAAVRERGDRLEEMGVLFLGAATDVPAGPTPVFKPVPVVATFEYTGDASPQPVLEKAYVTLWNGVVATFPPEAEWSQSKRDYAQYITSQADLLRARTEAGSQ